MPDGRVYTKVPEDKPADPCHFDGKPAMWLVVDMESFGAPAEPEFLFVCDHHKYTAFS